MSGAASTSSTHQVVQRGGTPGKQTQVDQMGGRGTPPSTQLVSARVAQNRRLLEQAIPQLPARIQAYLAAIARQVEPAPQDGRDGADRADRDGRDGRDGRADRADRAELGGASRALIGPQPLRPARPRTAIDQLLLLDPEVIARVLVGLKYMPAEDQLRLPTTRLGIEQLFVQLATARYSLDRQHPAIEGAQDVEPVASSQRGVEHITSSCYAASILNLIAVTPRYRAMFDPQVNVTPEGSQARALQVAIAPMIGTLRGNGVVPAASVRALLALLGRMNLLQAHAGELLEAQQDANQVIAAILQRVMPAAGNTLTTREARTYDDPRQAPITENERQFVLQLTAVGHRTLEDALRAYFVAGQHVAPTGVRNPFTMTRQVTGFPEVLSIAMTRQSGDDTIDMPAEFTAPAEIAAHGVALPRYRLQAFIVRTTFSQLAGGHYVAVMRTGDGHWLESDDIGTPKPHEDGVMSPRTREIDPGTHRLAAHPAPAYMLATLYTYVRVPMPAVAAPVAALGMGAPAVMPPQPQDRGGAGGEPAAAPRVGFSTAWTKDPAASGARVAQAMQRALGILGSFAPVMWEAIQHDKGFIDEVPGGPAVRFKGVWYTRADLKAWVVDDKDCLGARYLPDLVGMIDHLTAGQEFATWRALQTELMVIQNNKDRLDSVAQKQRSERAARERAEAAKERERQELLQQAAAARGGSAPSAGTSLEARLPQSDAIEQEIGKLAAQHAGSRGAAAAMAAQVVAFCDDLKRTAGIDLYLELGTANKETAGAVGTDGATVREALTARDATLQEQMTHVLAFRAVLGNHLMMKPDHDAVVAAATRAGFDRGMLDELERGASSREHAAIFGLKDAIIKRRSGPPATNQRTAEQVGIPFSGRERAVWGSDTPQFGVGSQQVDVDGANPWVKDKRAQGLPVKSGPSTHTLEIFEIARLLGLERRVHPDHLRMAATGYLLPIGAHSLVEIEHVAAMFGCELCRGPEAYAQRLAELGGVRVPAPGTGKALFDQLSLEFDKPGDAGMIAAHHYLLAHGYAFAGFHGTSAAICKSIFTLGFNESFETREPTDPWRGFYVAPELETATGYSGSKKDSALLRIYAPAEIVARLTQARLGLDKGDEVLGELRGRLGHALPLDRDYFIVGREDSDREDLEAVLSWHAAKQCIAIPSLHRPEENRRGVAVRSATEAGLPAQTAVPSKLTFEGEGAPTSTGGNKFAPPAASGGSAGPSAGPAKPGAESPWVPSGGYLNHTDWDGGRPYVASFPAKEAPTPVEVAQLTALGLKVKLGDSWQQVCEQSLPFQANATSLREMLAPLAGVSIGSAAWRDFAMQFASAKDATEIEPRMFLSGHASASNVGWQRAHVRFVLNCCQYTFRRADGVAYENVNVIGFELGLFEWASQQLAAHAGGGVLVHCIEGKNRSATVLCAYLMKAKGLTARDAIRYLRSKRPWAEPDVESLTQWEAALHKKK